MENYGDYAKAVRRFLPGQMESYVARISRQPIISVFKNEKRES